MVWRGREESGVNQRKTPTRVLHCSACISPHRQSPRDSGDAKPVHYWLNSTCGIPNKDSGSLWLLYFPDSSRIPERYFISLVFCLLIANFHSLEPIQGDSLKQKY